MRRGPGKMLGNCDDLFALCFDYELHPQLQQQEELDTPCLRPLPLPMVPVPLLIVRTEFVVQPPAMVSQTTLMPSAKGVMQDTSSPLQLAAVLPPALREQLQSGLVHPTEVHEFITVQVRRMDMRHLETYDAAAGCMRALHAPACLCALRWSADMPDVVQIDVHRKTLPVSAGYGGAAMVLVVLFKARQAAAVAAAPPCSSSTTTSRKRCREEPKSGAEEPPRYIVGAAGIAVSSRFLVRSKTEHDGPCRPPRQVLRARNPPPRAFTTAELVGTTRVDDALLTRLLVAEKDGGQAVLL